MVSENKIKFMVLCMVLKIFWSKNVKNVVVALLAKGCYLHLIHFHMNVELNICKTGDSA